MAKGNDRAEGDIYIIIIILLFLYIALINVTWPNTLHSEDRIKRILKIVLAAFLIYKRQ